MNIDALLKDVRLPQWLLWYLRYGTQVEEQSLARQQLMANVILGITGVSTMIHAFVYALLPGLMLVGLAAACIALVFLLAVFFFNRAPAATLVIGITTVGGLICSQTYLGGTATGVHLFMLVGPIFWVAILGASRIGLLLITCVVSVGCVIFSEYSFQQPALAAANNEAFQKFAFAVNVTNIGLFGLVFGFVALLRAQRAEESLAAEHARSEALLYNLLPEGIAARLKVEPDQTIADSLPNVAILFADIVDFTPRAASLPPEEVVGFLNRIFRAFDELAEKHQLEKIKTIGDAYMVAAGMPNPCRDPVHRVAEMALDMQRTVAEMSDKFADGLKIRIGLHTGPVVAGVIGNKKLFYDVWGETVNTASRMESHGEPGRIQVTGATLEELSEDYLFEPRGIVGIKGVGSVETWWLTGKAA